MSYSALVPNSAAAVSLVNQAADIGSTNLIASATAGVYRASMYLVDAASDLTAGAVVGKISYTDSTQAQTLSMSAVALTTLGTFTQSTFFIQVANATAISYSTTHTGIFGSAKYNLYISLERLN